MSLYSSIVSEASTYEQSETPISNLAHKYNFTIIDLPDDQDPLDYYDCFKAEKLDGTQKIVITITTRDKYRSFCNDDSEPYHNKVELFENGKCINKYEYTYFK